MDGFDFLGTIPIEEYIGDKAADAGQRALAASQRIAKRAPKLAATIAAAAKRALAAGKSVAQTPVAPPTQTQAVTPSKAPQLSPAQLNAPTRLGPMTGRGPTVNRPQPAPPGRGRARVGDDPVDPQQADMWAQLADAASAGADFIASIQDIVNQLPQDLPLVAQGQGLINQYQLLICTPIDNALSGTAAPTPRTVQALIDSVQNFNDMRASGNPGPLNDWFSKANGYLRIHPPAQKPDADTKDASAPPPGTTPPVPVAKLAVSPLSISVAQGLPQQFSVAAADAAGKPVSPAPTVAWSISPATGATIDQNGNFLATSAGTYTITASAGGITGTGTAIVQGSASSPPPGGGGGGGGGYAPQPPSDGGGYPPPDDGGGYDSDVPDDGGDGSDQDSEMGWWRIGGDGFDALGADAPELPAQIKQTLAQRSAQIDGLTSRSRAELRSLAFGQIAKVREHFGHISWLSRHLPILSAKWDATTANLDKAQHRFDGAEVEMNEAVAKPLYVQALLGATEAAAWLAAAAETSIAADLVTLPSVDTKGEPLTVPMAKQASESMLTRKVAVPVIGQVPVWGVAAGGVGLAGAAVLVARKLLT